MKKQVSQRDLEGLSSFSDGQLKPDEMKKLESRLQTEGQLKDTLSEIEWIRGVLRNLPSIPAPHSFMLTPELVKKPEYTRLFSTFRLMSALATLLFIIVATGDYFYLTQFVGSNRSDRANQQLVMEPELDTTTLEEGVEAPESYSTDIGKVQEARGLLATETSVPASPDHEMVSPTESFEKEESIQILAEAPMEMEESQEMLEKMIPLEEGDSLGNAQIELFSSTQIEEEPPPVMPEGEKESENIIITDDEKRADLGLESTLESPLEIEPYPENHPNEEGGIKNFLSGSKHMWLFFIEASLALIAIIFGIFAYYYRHKSKVC